MVRRMVEGINVTDETLAVDVIRKVGPGGHFLSQSHTRQYHKKELFLGKISNKKSYGAWVKANSIDARQKSRDIAKDILETYKPEPIDDDVLRELRQYIKHTEKSTKLD